MTMNIAIDGPSGSGKSTIAKLLAKKLGILYLDTGAMYRGVAYYMVKRGIEPSDEKGVLSVLDDIKMDIAYDDDKQKVIICGEDVTAYIREHSVSMAASTVSKIPEVRLKLVELQREIASRTACVLDGRDIGSYVLPNAEYKFFMTASPEVRAKRRCAELKAKGQDIPYETVLNDIVARDYQDTHREFAPLKAVADSVIVDTTDMSIEQVAEVFTSAICK